MGTSFWLCLFWPHREQARSHKGFCLRRKSNVGASLLAMAFSRLTQDQASRNSQGWLARCLASNEAIASPSCKVRPMSSRPLRSEEHTSELQSLMRISYAVFCLKKKKKMTTAH